jgi:hypothetical protein
VAELAIGRKIFDVIKKCEDLRSFTPSSIAVSQKRIIGIQHVQRVGSLSSGFFTQLPCPVEASYGVAP